MPKATVHLRQTRKNRGLKVAELATLVGAKAHHLRNVECQAGGLSIELANRIASVLDVPAASFLELPEGVTAEDLPQLVNPIHPVDEVDKPTVERLAFNSHQAAETLGVSPRAVLALIKNGELAHRKIGRSYIIPRSEIERLLDSCERKAV
ncbi:helix-turn-helix domain-containing protein [Amycolatopsis pithecellobii]|nr:helix-turn-helix domain-containing protein [Amycolatopsis pithecellobii]